MKSPGAQLKGLRLKKGLSLEEVHKKTKIHLNILKSIEEDNFANLSPIYVKGFLKMYCQFLGIDPKEYALDYQEPEIPIHIPATKENKHGEPTIKASHEPLINFTPQLKRALLYAVGGILVVFILAIGINKIKDILAKRKLEPKRQRAVSQSVTRKTAKQSIQQKKPLPVRTTGNTVIKTQEQLTTQVVWKPQISNAPVKTEVIGIATAGIRLGIHAKDDCWIHLKIDGKTVFQNVLKKGRFELWQAKDRMELSIGNAGSISLELNGKFISALGRKGQPLKNIVITKDGLKTE